MSRRRVLLAAITGSAAAVYPVGVEPRWLDLTRVHTTLTPAPRDLIRVLHLTDLHASWAVPMALISKAVEIGLDMKPDIVCLTGDFITHRSDFDTAAYVPVLRRLSRTHPTFAILGNHDGGMWAGDHLGNSDHSVVERVLEDSGISLLHNRSESVWVRGTKLTLAGVGDLWSGELDPDKTFRSVDANDPLVLLSHNPDSKDVLERYPWNLMLCGHTHGGQIIVPFQGPIYAPVRDRRFVAGLNMCKGRPIYTSRGVGSIGSVRFRCRPEVTIHEIKV